MSYQYLTIERDAAVSKLTLRRPEVLNALSDPLLEEFLAAVNQVGTDGSRALVITGAGRAFCAGADLLHGLPDDAGLVLEKFYNPLIETLLALPLPVIAAVNGPAVGAGCSIAIACDFVLASRSAYFLQAFVGVGLIPDAGATWVLPRLVGRARASAMMMLGERIGAEQAKAWGLIHECVDDSELERATAELATRLASGPTLAYRLIREGIRFALDHSLTETLRLERVNQRQAGQTKDVAEGVAAFRAKRRPNFTGC
jgi:2-(1,2-epoxy-1,2-dihydrophenyl)acetyl-CoA isomerase